MLKNYILHLNKKKFKIREIILLIVFLFGFASISQSQLLFRSTMEEENYARNGYYKYGRSLVNRAANPRYDSFGNYIMDGVQVFEWEEQKINSRHIQDYDAYSHILKTNPQDEGEYFREYLNNLVVVSESQKSFSSRFTVGNEIRVNFSPLTVDMAAMNGLRWDFNIKNVNNLTFISSRSDLPMYFPKEYISEKLRYRVSPVYLTGGHFDRKFGIFNFAMNYVNQYRSDSSQSRQKNSITGTMPYNMPDVLYVVVKLEDESRKDAGGPRLYDLAPVLDGVRNDSLLVAISEGSWENDFTDVNKYSESQYLYTNRYFLDPERIPIYSTFESTKASNIATKYTNYILRRDAITESFNKNAKFLVDRFPQITKRDGTDKKYLEVNNGDYLQFWYQINARDIEKLEFISLIGNDYKFSVSHIYKNTMNAMGNKNATYFNVAKTSPGNVKDMSNLSWVKFRYGQQTSVMLMGFRIDSSVKDFDFVAEYNKNLNYKQYPSSDGSKYREDAEAYYVNLKKKFGKLALGTEYFKISPDYTTSFQNVDPYYIEMNNLPYNSWKNYFTDDVALTGGSDNPTTSVSPQAYMNNTMVIDTVDDNDDKDRYPDWNIYSDVRDRNGVYPGLDENGNYRPDTNENDNILPDYDEPFLLYYIDPDEYDYGDDLNNNGVIDARENDDKADYPYDKDTKGYHLFTSYGEDYGFKSTLGVVNFKQMSGSGETDVRYAKMQYRKFIPFFADIKFATTAKKVEDTIDDNVFRYARTLSTTLRDSLTYDDNIFYTREGLQAEKYYDPLDYRNSYSSQSYFETKIFRVPNLTMTVKLKYEINHQLEDANQDKNDIINRTQVYKADYRYYYKKFLIMPQVKYLTRKMTNHDGYTLPFHEEAFYPILRFEYPITIKTKLKAGMQGFPGFNAKIRNEMNDQLDYDSRDMLLMLTNTSVYNGYDFSLNFGFKTYWQDLKGIERKYYSRTDKMFFIRLVVGMEPIS